MTPKKRAKQIVNSFKLVDYDMDDMKRHKEQSIIAVDIILNVVGAKDWQDDIKYKCNYWQEVKNEIQNL